MAASRSPLVRLRHIRDEITALTAALGALSFEDFAADYMRRRTAEHAILIISEATKALSPSYTDHVPGVDWRAIRGIGNVLRHDYFAVDARVLWDVFTDRLPELARVVDRMIADEEQTKR